MLFKNTWVLRYLKTERCIHNNGNEFLGADFQRLLVVNGIFDVPTTVKNPQSNAICEQMHQTAGNIICTLTHSNPPQNMVQATQIVDSALATTMHALQCSMHHALQMSPGAFVFCRDMFLNIPLIANLQTIQDLHQLLIDENLRQQNLKRRSFDYAIIKKKSYSRFHNLVNLMTRQLVPF